jgi:hypothetical protein
MAAHRPVYDKITNLGIQILRHLGLQLLSGFYRNMTPSSRVEHLVPECKNFVKILKPSPTHQGTFVLVVCM